MNAITSFYHIYINFIISVLFSSAWRCMFVRYDGISLYFSPIHNFKKDQHYPMWSVCTFSMDSTHQWNQKKQMNKKTRLNFSITFVLIRPSSRSFVLSIWFRIQRPANAAVVLAAADVEHNTTIRLCHRLPDRPCAIPKYQYLIHSLLHHRKNCKMKWNNKKTIVIDGSDRGFAE